MKSITTITNAMKPGTRLLVRLTFSDNSQRGWGYDYPHYPTAEILQRNLEEDFETIPENTEIHLFYDELDEVITADTGVELAKKAIDWLKTTGSFF